MSTRAITALRRAGIPVVVGTYSREEKGAVFAGTATGFRLERTLKTLVVDLGEKGCGLVLMPGDRRLSLKRLAEAWGTKRAAMADGETAERNTGYLVGGISPFGTRRPLPVLMEESALKWEQVMVNGGRRGTMLRMDPRDIRDHLDARVAEVAEAEPAGESGLQP